MKPHHLPEKCPTCSAPIRELTGEGLQEAAKYACVTWPTDFGPAFFGSHMEVSVASGDPFFRRICPHSDEAKAARAMRQARENQINEAVAAALAGVKATYEECVDFSSRMTRHKHNGVRGIWQLLPSKERT